MYFKNVWYQAYLPFNSGASWDRFGMPYNISRVIPNGVDLDKDAYEAYSPLYLSTTLSLVYTTGFAMLTSVLTHTVLYHGKALKKGIMRVRTEEDDVHAKFMRHYPEAPDWWYACMFLAALVFGVIMIEVYDTGLPIWALLVAIAIPAIYILPTGFVFAMTGQAIGTNLIGELIVGYLLPGKPLPNMIFKAYALQGLLGGLQFVQDLKLGHYMKIPPRLTFMAQLTGVLVACFVQLGVKQWMFANIKGICSPDQPDSFTCPHIRVFYTASLVWGAIGPARMFGNDSIYRPMYWAMLVGALIPIPFWLAARRYPQELDPIHQLAGHLCRCVVHPACEWDQLLVVVRGGVHLPVPRAQVQLPLVVQVQLCPRRRHGQRHDHLDHCGLLCAGAAQERLADHQLVGQRGGCKDV